jgi:small-conductance mechanosensitive channel
MLRIKIFLLITVASFIIFYTKAQDTSTYRKDSLNIEEELLIQNQQQRQIDSLVKIKLERELQTAEGNREKTLELEKKLREIAFNDSLRNTQQLEKIRNLKKSAKGYPVTLNNDTLFYTYVRTGSFTAMERAAATSKKIIEVYDDPFYQPDSLLLIPNDDSFDIVYKKNILLTVSRVDALWFNKSNAELAAEYFKLIKDAIQKEREAHSLINWMKRIGLVVLIIIVLTVIVSFINRLFKRSAEIIHANHEKYSNGLNIKNIKIFTPLYLENFLQRINNIIRIVVIVLVIYLSLPLLFSIFPETKAWTGTLLGWILKPLKIAFLAVIDYLPNLFTILVIYFIFKYVLQGIRFFFHEIKKGNIRIRGFHTDWAIPTFSILRFMLYAFMVIIIFPYLPGSSSPAFQGVSVFLGVLFSLGSSSAISNIVSGLVITYMRPFKVGDRVKVGDVVGDVIEKTLLVTRIKTIKNEDVTVPNSMVLSSSTVNYSNHTAPEKLGLIIHYTVTVGYDVPWIQVYDILIQSAKSTLHILEQPEPFVLQVSLDDYYISYQINAYTREANQQALIYSNLLERIQDNFKAAGIEILSPSYNVIRKEEQNKTE